jgi:hypothetical protein
MKYNAPFGSADPNAAYVDRNTPGAVSGSRVPALAIEAPQREIEAVIVAAGIDPNKADMTQLLQAIGKLIDAATGGGGDDNYLLMTQARSRLPIFPEVLTADGRLPVISPANGTVRLQSGYQFLHRGIFNVTTVQSDFSTVANKTYHLRWTKEAGFALKDLADSAYNSGALPETDVVFDSSYDDMLVARVVTSGGNVATIKQLANKARLFASFAKTTMEQKAGGWTGLPALQAEQNWARTPNHKAIPSFNVEIGSDIESAVACNVAASRYTVEANVYGYIVTPTNHPQPYISGRITVDLGAY